MLLEFWNSSGNLLQNLVMLNYTCKLFRPYFMINLLVSLNRQPLDIACNVISFLD